MQKLTVWSLNDSLVFKSHMGPARLDELRAASLFKTKWNRAPWNDATVPLYLGFHQILCPQEFHQHLPLDDKTVFFKRTLTG